VSKRQPESKGGKDNIISSKKKNEGGLVTLPGALSLSLSLSLSSLSFPSLVLILQKWLVVIRIMNREKE
jgi:hypothetical protein